MSNRKGKKSIIYLLVLLLTLGLTIGFSAFQNELFINDILLKVRLQRDVRVSDSTISKTSGAVVNDQEYNKTKLLGNVTFDSTSSYVLYKVDLTNYGNVKSGLLNINSNTSGINYSICDSNGSNCTNNLETPICNGSNCTLGATKEVYVKVSSTTSGTKNIDLDLDIQPYVNISYDNIRENTSDFKTEVLETSTYQITLTSKPEEVEVTGDVTASYNKNTGVLILSNIQSDLTIQAKYLLTEVAHTSYTEAAPENYVRFNNVLYRIITKENIDDGYGNTELRTKITSDSPIGNNVFDDESNEYGLSSLKDELNTTYYNSLNSISKELIDTAKWTNESVENIGLINNSSWLRNDQYTLTKAENNKVVAVTSTGLVDSEISVSRTTYPVVYLKTSVLVVGGTGTSTDPYILDLASNGLQPNPTVISRRTLTVTGFNQNLVTVSNKVGTPYYSVGTSLNSSNYTSGSTTIPSRSNAGSYTIYYYIPAEGIYKAKAGSVTSIINPLTFTITYQKGSNVSAIGKTSDSCTTSGSSLTCSVTLPSITPNNGYDSVGWSLTNGDTAGVTGSYTLSANGVKLYANAVVKHNYQNTTTLAYYGTLNDAFGEVADNQIIKVLEDATETTSATLASGKTGIKLDLNGKIITMSNTQITNNGELDIYNTSSTDGKINGGSRELIYNDGILTLNGTSTTNKTIIDKTIIAQSNGRCIFNYIHGQITINDNAEIKADISGQNGIALNGGHLTMTGGSIKTVSNAVSMGAGIVNISGGSITSTSARGLYCIGTTTITGGTITGYSSGVFSDGVLTLGANDSNVNNTFPIIQATGTSNNYGLYNDDGDFYFYDGVIKSASGSGYAINSNPTNIPDGYKVQKTVSNGVESAYLSKTVTATFYYNSNSTYDGLTISSTTASCVTGVNGSCTVTVPSAVTNSVGHYNAPYNSVSNQISNMNSSSLTISEDTNFYANYSAPVTIYYPTSTSARSSSVYYKNEYFMDNGETAPTEMASVIAVNNTTKTNMTFTPSVSGYSLYGFANNEGTNTRDFASVSALARTQQNSAYAIIRKSITATFYYNSNTTAGSLTVSTATSSGYQYIRCTSTAAEVSNGSISVPSEVSGSVGQYGSAYKGITSSTSNMTTENPTTAHDTFYAAYSGDVTIYYPSSTTARSSTVYKRNEFFSSNSAMTAVLATSNTATTNFTFNSAVSGYDLYGFSNSASTNTRNYSSVSALAQSDKTTSYAILRVGKTATVYYNSGSGNGTLSVSTATTATAYQYLRCTSTAAELSNSNYTIPTSVSGSVGQYGNTYYGTASAVNSMTNARTTAYTTLYAIYRNNNVTNYYYGSSYTNRTLYRNNMFTSTTAMKSVLSTSGTGTSNYSTATGPGSSVWTGLSTGQDTTAEYSSVANAAASTATTLYTVYTFNVTYAKGSNVSAIGATSGSCKVTTSSTSCNVTLPSITPNSGYVAVGWSTTKDATTGTAAGSNYSLSTNAQTLYGNVKAGQFTITFNKNYNNLTNMPANGSSDSAGPQVIYSWTNNTGYTVTITEAGSDVDVCKSDWTAYYQPKVTLRVNNVDKVTIQEQSPDTGSNGHVSGLNISVSNGQTVTMYSYGYTAGGQSKTFWYGNSNQCFFKYKINDTGTTQKTYYTNDTTAIGKIFSNIDGHTISSYNTASGGGGTSFATTATPKQIFASQGSSPTLYAIWQ